MHLICQCPKRGTDDCNSDCIQRQEAKNDTPAIILKAENHIVTQKIIDLFHELRDELGLIDPEKIEAE